MTSQTATPLWVQVPAVIASIVTATGLIIAGVWSYMRFVRGRTLHATCTLGLSAKQLTMPDNSKVLKITATVTNSGGLRLILPLFSEQSISVYRCDSVLWDDAIQHCDKEVLWSAGKFHECDMLKSEGINTSKILEPGERLRRYILVPIANSPCLAYRIAMAVHATPKLMWRTRPPIKWDTELVFGARETNAG